MGMSPRYRWRHYLIWRYPLDGKSKGVRYMCAPKEKPLKYPPPRVGFDLRLCNVGTVDDAPSLEDTNQEYASRGLELTKWNKSQASKVLNISRVTLSKMLSPRLAYRTAIESASGGMGEPFQNDVISHVTAQGISCRSTMLSRCITLFLGRYSSYGSPP